MVTSCVPATSPAEATRLLPATKKYQLIQPMAAAPPTRTDQSATLIGNLLAGGVALGREGVNHCGRGNRVGFESEPRLADRHALHADTRHRIEDALDPADAAAAVHSVDLQSQLSHHSDSSR